MRSTPIFGDPQSPFAPDFSLMLELGMKSFFDESYAAEVASVLPPGLQGPQSCSDKSNSESEDDEILDAPFDLLWCKAAEPGHSASDSLERGPCDGGRLREVDLFVDISETCQSILEAQAQCFTREEETGEKQGSLPEDPFFVTCDYEDGFSNEQSKNILQVDNSPQDPAALVEHTRCHSEEDIFADDPDENTARGGSKENREWSVVMNKEEEKSRDAQLEVSKCVGILGRPSLGSPLMLALKNEAAYVVAAEHLNESPDGLPRNKDKLRSAAVDSQGEFPIKFHNFDSPCRSDGTTKHPRPPYLCWRPAHSKNLYWASTHTAVSSPEPSLESLSIVPSTQAPPYGIHSGVYGPNEVLPYAQSPAQEDQVSVSTLALFKPLSGSKTEHSQSRMMGSGTVQEYNEVHTEVDGFYELCNKKDPVLNVLLEGVKSWTNTKLRIEVSCFITSQQITCRLAQIEPTKRPKAFVCIQDLYGYMADLCKDQAGSRFIQRQLECASKENFADCFQELINDLFMLMLDPFGNYVIQKLFDRGSPEQIQSLGDQLKNKVLTLSLHMYGSRVLQKALETLGLKTRASLARELKGHVPECIKDRSGNYVIQKCIICLSASQIEFIVEPLMEQASALATHSYGCRVLQRLLEHCDDNTWKFQLVEKVLQHGELLTQDQYGNYVIQHVFEHGMTEQRNRVIQFLCQNIVALSVHKFASNVVERCLLLGNELERRDLISSILNRDGSRPVGPLHDMMKDRYGNFVVQRLLEVSDRHQEDRYLILEQVHFIVLVSIDFLYSKDRGRNQFISFLTDCLRNCRLPLEFIGNEGFSLQLKSVLSQSPFESQNHTSQVSNEAQREEILRCIYCHVPELKRVTYGKHLLGRVQGFNQNETPLEDPFSLSECSWML